MRLPGPFEIHRVQEFEWPERELDFLLLDVTREDFNTTRTSTDARFVDVERGLLRMSFHSFVVRTPQGVLLVDTCVGNDKERQVIPEWHMQNFPYLSRLRDVGLTPEDIDYVCCTHLHGDHVGWNTRLENGRWVPTFPNARYLFADAEVSYWEQFHVDNPGNVYGGPWNDSVLPVIEAGLVDRVASDHEIMSGIRLSPAPGHTPGNVVIELGDGQSSAVMSGDVLHHPVQIERPQWASVFDNDPDHARVTRRGLLERVADTSVLLMGAHFAAPTALQVESDADCFMYR